jgi:hypothetical protein
MTRKLCYFVAFACILAWFGRDGTRDISGFLPIGCAVRQSGHWRAEGLGHWTTGPTFSVYIINEHPVATIRKEGPEDWTAWDNRRMDPAKTEPVKIGQYHSRAAAEDAVRKALK